MTNGTPKDLYVPSDIQLGGQRTSASQLETITRCRQEFFLHYLAPHPEVPDSAGLTTRVTTAPLLVGIGAHAGLHAYDLSGWRDGADSGERDLMKALAHAEETLKARQQELEDPDEFEKALHQTRNVLIKFDELRTAGAISRKRVVADANGKPVLEREFHLPLAGGKFVYVDKVDGVFENEEGYHEVGERKTSTFRYERTLTTGLHMRGQSYGHMAVLTTSYPTAPLNGVHFWIHVKDRGAKSDLPHIRERTITIPREQVETYLWHVEEWLYDITDRTEAWQDNVEAGMEPYEAALARFPLDGLMNGSCPRFGRLCQFASYCEAHTFGPKMLQGFQPRTVGGKPVEYEGEASREGEVF